MYIGTCLQCSISDLRYQYFSYVRTSHFAAGQSDLYVRDTYASYTYTSS